MLKRKNTYEWAKGDLVKVTRGHPVCKADPDGVWPDVFLNGIHSFVSALASFNFIFPVDQLFLAIQFFIGFEVLMYTAKMIISIVGFFRGTDNIKI